MSNNANKKIDMECYSKIMNQSVTSSNTKGIYLLNYL